MTPAFPPPPARKPLGSSTAHAMNRTQADAPLARAKPCAPPLPPAATGFNFLGFASTVTSTVLGALDDVAAQIDQTPAPYEEYRPLAAARCADVSSYDEFVAPSARGACSAKKRRAASVASSAETAERASRRARAPSPPPLLGLLSDVGATLGSALESTVSGLELSVELVDRWLDDTLDSVLGQPAHRPATGKAPRAAVEPSSAPNAPWAFRLSSFAVLEAEAKARMRALSAEPWLLLDGESHAHAVAPEVAVRLPQPLSTRQLDALLPMARAAIGGDERLMGARQHLVPKRMGERAFWAAYLARCVSIKREVVFEFGAQALARGAGGRAGGDGKASCASDAELAEAWAQELELTLPLSRAQ
ncbi:hypothetical protein KFE25_012256 [Diacronema lutheri]|uniref:BSD domain-containing protein n=1 Tax=Diacronema lutheri TaxID=2081491 RepID=A0A8J5XBI9_DIALT|nr:hypothetical protein KFE25_012256 [Diacronema lutheri]